MVIAILFWDKICFCFFNPIQGQNFFFVPLSHTLQIKFIYYSSFTIHTHNNSKEASRFIMKIKLTIQIKVTNQNKQKLTIQIEIKVSNQMKIGSKLQKGEFIDQLFKLEMSKLLEEALNLQKIELVSNLHYKQRKHINQQQEELKLKTI